MKFVSSHFPTMKVGTQGFNMSRMAYNDIPSTENRLLIYVVRPVRISMLYDNEIRKLTFPHGESWHSSFSTCLGWHIMTFRALRTGCSYMSFVLYEFPCDMTMKFASSHFPTVKVGTQGFNMSRMAYNDIPSTENRLLIYVVRPVRISMRYD